VWLVDFDPMVDKEIAKTRPAVVVSVDRVGRLPLRIVVPITHWKMSYGPLPWHVFLPPTAGSGLKKDSSADCFQVKSVALKRFKKKIAVLMPQKLDEIAAAIALCTGLV